MVTLPGGSFWSFCCCAAVLGVTVLKPEATSMLSLFCVLVCVVAQPTVSANRAMTLIISNETSFFIFLVPLGLRLSWRWFHREERIRGGVSDLRSPRSAEQFHKARLVRITDRGFAIWLDPVGMLDPQVVVNLLLELGVGVDLVIHGNWLGERFKCGARWFPQRARWNRRRVLAPCARATAKLGHSKRR